MSQHCHKFLNVFCALAKWMLHVCPSYCFKWTNSQDPDLISLTGKSVNPFLLWWMGLNSKDAQSTTIGIQLVQWRIECLHWRHCAIINPAVLFYNTSWVSLIYSFVLLLILLKKKVEGYWWSNESDVLQVKSNNKLVRCNFEELILRVWNCFIITWRGHTQF